MTADVRTLVVTGEEPPKTCVGAERARSEAIQRVKRGEAGVRIVNAGGEAFRWWPELCSERACCSPAEGGTRCARHAVQEPRSRRGRRALDRVADVFLDEPPSPEMLP